MKKPYSKYKVNAWLDEVMDFDKKFYLRRAGKDRDMCTGHANIFRCPDCKKEWQTLPYNSKDNSLKTGLKAGFIEGFYGVPMRRQKPPKVFCENMCDVNGS
tara:strand:- start:523 stop:825 length:303 start_codon:yes stop_codon:yes gene_type:complete